VFMKRMEPELEAQRLAAQGVPRPEPSEAAREIDAVVAAERKRLGLGQGRPPWEELSGDQTVERWVEPSGPEARRPTPDQWGAPTGLTSKKELAAFARPNAERPNLDAELGRV